MYFRLRYPKFVANLFAGMFVLGIPSIFAQNTNEELKMHIQLRPRAEIRNGLFTPILEGQRAAAFVAQRSRLGLTYSKNKKLEIGLNTQVVSIWGNDPQVQTTSNEVSLYEAWAKLYFNPEWSIKVGRQELNYDDERILGSLNWNNAGRKHDAALLEFSTTRLKADAVFAFNQNKAKITDTYYDNSFSQPYKAMELLWLKYKFTDAFSASAIFINLNMQSTMDSSVSYLQTMGGNVFYKKENWNVTGTIYFQSGKNPANDLAPVKTSAWMAALKTEYQINKKWRLGIGSDYLSGKDMNSTFDKITYFSPLYGTQHKFYGFMDYFYVSSPHNHVGLWDSYLQMHWNANERLNTQLALHHFVSAASVINYSGNKTSPVLGNEADLTIGYKIMKEATLSGGYSQMFANTSMKYVKDILPFQKMKPFQNWMWLSLNINPDILLFKSE